MPANEVAMHLEGLPARQREDCSHTDVESDLLEKMFQIIISSDVLLRLEIFVAVHFAASGWLFGCHGQGEGGFVQTARKPWHDGCYIMQPMPVSKSSAFFFCSALSAA